MDIRTLCLGLLTFREASGYEIKKHFEDHLSHFYEASFGSIYPALTRLTEERLVICTEQAQERRPDKKVYRITPAGRLTFLDELMKPPGRDRFRSDFLATMLFAHLLPARYLSEIIDARIAEYRGLLAGMEPCSAEDKPAGGRFVEGFGVAIYRAAIAYLEENRHLVEGEALLAPPSAAD